MSKPDLVYTTYIRTTPAKLWDAIINPEFTRQYWGSENVSDWKPGSKWAHVADDEQRTVRVVGQVLESVPTKRLVLSWADPDNENDLSRVTFEIEPVDDLVRLNVIHDDFRPDSDMADKVSGGWPRVLSSLKTLLETNRPLWEGSACGKKPAAKADIAAAVAA